MTTTTAVPSSDVSDFLYNVQKLDEIATGSALTYVDRFGVERLTATGVMARFAALNPRGAWATATVYQPRDLVLNSGTWYIALDTHTSGATFAGDLTTHWRPEQGVTDAELASTASALDGDGRIGVLQPVTGARARTQHAKNADWITALDMTGIDPTGVADSTAALQALINTGGPVLLPEGTYSAAGLTQSAADQQFIGLGKVTIVRRSGATPLLSSSGRAVQFHNIKFLGNSAGSGDCVVCTGDNPVFNNCSIWTNSGYALWCKGNGARVSGTNDIYYSPDASGAAIAFGVLGSTTLYGQITNIVTSTSSVGIKYLDHGASGIANCQLNKVDMSKGAAYISNCRIAGDYVVGKSFNEIDNCTISGNVTLGDGTSLSGIGFGSKVFVQTGSTVTVNVGIRESTLHLAHLGSGVTITDNLTGTATDVENFIFTAARSYTPAWTAASVNPSLGNGTLTGTYVRNGRMVTDTISMTIGSTTTTGTGEYFFSTSHNPGTRKYCGSSVILDAGTALFTAIMRTRGDGTARMNGYTNNAGTGLQQNSPMTWATGDTLDATISYVAP